MRTRSTLIAITLLFSLVLVIPAQQSGDELFRQARQKEQGDGDIVGAIQIYERVVRESSDRGLVAQTLFRLSDCYDKVGQQAKSWEALEKLAKDYGDTEPGGQAKLRLTVMASQAPLRIDTPYADDLFAFALSPDGRNVVYQATVGGKAQLWLHSLDTGKAAPLPGTEGTREWALPFWSPDGKSVGFFADGKLKRVDIAGITGGNARELADAPWPRGGTWNKDGIILFAPFNIGALHTVPATGGARTAITPDDVSRRQWPQFLPDGRRFIFLSNATTPTNQWLVRTLGDTAVPARLVSIYGEPAVAVAAPDRLLVQSGVMLTSGLLNLQTLEMGRPTPVAGPIATEILSGKGAFSASSTGVVAYRVGGGISRRLIRRDRQGRELSSFDLPPGTDKDLRLSPDAKSAVFRSSPNSDNLWARDLWLMDLGSNTGRVFLTQPENSTAFSPVWSPDGTELATAHAQGSYYNLFTEKLSGGNARRIVGSPEVKWACDWSVKGFFLYQRVSRGETRADLLAVPVQGALPISAAGPGARGGAGRGDETVSVSTTTAMESCGRFSPDGQWVAFHASELGRDSIYVQPFSESPVNASRRIVVANGTMPEWRGDGRELYYLSGDNQLMAMSVTPSPDGQSVELGKPVALFPSPLSSGSTYAPFRDGQQFLINAPTGAAPPIFVMANSRPAAPNGANR